MSNQTFKPAFEEILSLMDTRVSSFQQKNIRELVNAHEWGIALETLCDFLYEETVEVPLKAYQLIKDIGNTIGLSSENWTDIEEQVSK